ncbi:unnamed protein product [Colias eurytheme]|nr:unnamed protein product [Colias eurytheme]
MPCCKVTIKKNLCNMKCDKFGCICIPTDGKDTVYLCLDDNNKIIRCADECDGSGSKCIAVETGGATCICVCKTDDGITKCDDCACTDDTKMQCDKQGCVCFKTDGKDKLLVCEDDENNIICCDTNEGGNCVCLPTDDSSKQLLTDLIKAGTSSRFLVSHTIQ